MLLERNLQLCQVQVRSGCFGTWVLLECTLQLCWTLQRNVGTHIAVVSGSTALVLFWQLGLVGCHNAIVLELTLQLSGSTRLGLFLWVRLGKLETWNLNTLCELAKSDKYEKSWITL